MADEFDDELYNVYKRAEADSNENVDIYKDSFQEENFDQSNVAASNDQNRAKGDQGSGESDQDTSTAVTAPESASSNVDQSASSMNEQQTIFQQQQQQQQQPMPFQQAASFSPQQAQAMMAAWAQFQANPYQLAAYQRALQQMGNPFQYQQMMMRQAMMQQQQQQQPQHYSSDGDMGGAKRSGTVSVASAANQDEGKMFIGGLNWETTDESLREYFSKFGEVTDCVVMRDPTTGRSRGFAFLTMADASVIDTIVSQEHHLDGKRIDPKRAIPREEQDKTEKIFVGGISQEVNEEEFREYFMQFGKVIDATLMTDRESGRPRGFGFITFENSDGVEEALRHPRLEIKGKPVEVKKAMPKSRQMRQAAMNQMAGGMGRGYMPNARYPVAAPYGMPAAGGAGRGYGFGNGMFNNMYGNFGAFNMNPFYGRTGSGQEYDSGSNTQAGDEAGGSGHNYESEERHEKEYRNDERGSNRDRYDKDYDHERSSRREYSRHGSSRHRESSRHESSRHGSSRHESSRHESSRYDERRHRRDSRDRDYDYDSGRSGSSGSGGGGAIHASQSSRSQNNYRPY